ncbi:MAG: hypothetical protein NZ955_07410 [Candidatus Bathyarchaeota archaeon]|nr:hypothetical protein [Candidatus Bathyarchaeota archaeon]
MLYRKPVYRWRRFTPPFIPLILLILFTYTPILYANPIPLPIAPLLSEDIDITIWVEGKLYVARVVGSYELGEPIGFYDTMTLRFPVPRDSWNTSIYVDGRSVSFTKINGTYSCKPIEALFDILEWTTSKGRHNVKVEYTHKLLDLGNGTLLFIYPIGSSKLASNATYAKGCRYKVNVKTILPPGSEADFEVLKRVLNPTISTPTYTWMKLLLNDSSFKLEGILGLDNMFDDLYIRLTPKSEGWTPYKPNMEEIREYEISVYDRCVNVTVKFIFRHSGFKIESRYKASQSYIRFDFYIYEWTGVTLPVLTEKKSSLMTEPLDPGRYLVQIFVSNIEVASIEVAIPDNGGSHPSDQGDSSQAILNSAFIGIILLLLSIMVVAEVYGWIRP